MRFIQFLEPRFLSSNRVISVIENTVVYLNVKCLTDGYPQPTTSWKIGEKILAPANGSATSALWNYDPDNNGFKGTYRVLSDGSLNIRGYFTKAPASQDFFSCVARNTITERRQNYTFIFEKCKYSFCRKMLERLFKIFVCSKCTPTSIISIFRYTKGSLCPWRSRYLDPHALCILNYRTVDRMTILS